ncbi:MAG: hypothetical protein RL380_1107 [Verrucomicrobiota bacterium]
MNARWFLGLSLAANLALGALVAPCFTRRAVVVAPVASSPADIASETAPMAAENAVVNLAEAFDWTRLASADFKKYRANLLAVGCPEETMRDIITAEIDEQFVQKRRALLEELQRLFWDRLAKDRDWLKDEKFSKPIEALNEAREKLLAEVLGEDKKADEDRRDLRARRNEVRYAWLPAEKRAQLFEVEEQARTQRNALQQEIAARADPTETDKDKARQKVIADELIAARKRVLSPEELAEFELRNSAAARWANYLPGFEASEEEWRAVAKSRRDYDEAIAKKPSDETKQQLEAAWEHQLQTTLGTNRYAQYETASDDAYQATRRITARYGLPDALAKEVAALQKAAQAAATRLRQDSSLSAEARAAALAAIQQETQAELAAQLGQNVFTTYQKYHGDWLEQMNQPPED